MRLSNRLLITLGIYIPVIKVILASDLHALNLALSNKLLIAIVAKLVSLPSHPQCTLFHLILQIQDGEPREFAFNKSLGETHTMQEFQPKFSSKARKVGGRNKFSVRIKSVHMNPFLLVYFYENGACFLSHNLRILAILAQSVGGGHFSF